MTIKYEQSPQKYRRHISESRLSIYDRIEIDDSDLWIPTSELENLLDKGLKGLSLQGLPLRTRSKVVKEEVCRVLGYPVPSSFKRTQPRFPGQVFDIYVQKSNNLQVWNEEISPARRYVIIRVSADDIIERVKVVTGDTLAKFDTTGTLTQKYQAQLITKETPAELVTLEDTDNLKSVLIQKTHQTLFDALPIEYPSSQNLLPIAMIFERLRELVDSQFADVGSDQERNRGAQLHQLICEMLGYQDFRDDGRFPDIRNQLLEVKLQTSPTVDLGLARPDSEELLDIPKIEGTHIRYCDIRYALFYANTDGKQVTLTHFYLTTGEAFFTRFPQFQGKTLNKKLQIPLPSDFFS
jgi:hypothetical protein